MSHVSQLRNAIHGCRPVDLIVVPTIQMAAMPFLLRFLETPIVEKSSQKIDTTIKFLGATARPNGFVIDHQRDVLE